MSETITIPAALVTYLRRGALQWQSNAAEDLSAVAGVLATRRDEGEIDLSHYEKALGSLHTSQLLLDAVGVRAVVPERDRVFDAEDYLPSVLHVLTVVHTQEFARLLAAGADGFSVPSSERVAELGRFVESLRDDIEGRITALHKPESRSANQHNKRQHQPLIGALLWRRRL